MNDKKYIRLSGHWHTPYSDTARVHFYDILDVFKQEGLIFTAKDVSTLFDITYVDARNRMVQLYKWNLIKVVSRAHVPKKASTYAVTNWGRKYLINRAKREAEQG